MTCGEAALKRRGTMMRLPVTFGCGAMECGAWPTRGPSTERRAGRCGVGGAGRDVAKGSVSLQQIQWLFSCGRAVGSVNLGQVGVG